MYSVSRACSRHTRLPVHFRKHCDSTWVYPFYITARRSNSSSRCFATFPYNIIYLLFDCKDHQKFRFLTLLLCDVSASLTVRLQPIYNYTLYINCNGLQIRKHPQAKPLTEILAKYRFTTKVYVTTTAHPRIMTYHGATRSEDLGEIAK